LIVPDSHSPDVVQQHGIEFEEARFRRLGRLQERDAVLIERRAASVHHARQVGILRLEVRVVLVLHRALDRLLRLHQRRREALDALTLIHSDPP
jgi:hypothetical protein